MNTMVLMKNGQTLSGNCAQIMNSRTSKLTVLLLVSLSSLLFQALGGSPYSFVPYKDVVNSRLVPIIAKGTAERKAVLTMLEICEMGQSIRQLFQTELENPVAPMMAFCFNQGRHMVTMNNYVDEGLAQSVVIYDFLRNKRRSFELRDFCSAEDIAKFSPSSYWKGKRWWGGAKVLPVLQSGIVYLMSSKLEDEEETNGVSVKINLIDLTIENLGWKAQAPVGVSEVIWAESACFAPTFFIGPEVVDYDTMKKAPKVPQFLRLTPTEKGMRVARLFDIPTLRGRKGITYKWDDSTTSFRVTKERPTQTKDHYWPPPFDVPPKLEEE